MIMMMLYNDKVPECGLNLLELKSFSFILAMMIFYEVYI